VKNIADISGLISGTVQGSQVPAALDPAHVAVDERDKARLLAYCVRIASVLEYYNQNDQPDGTWDSLLLADRSVLTAWILQYDGAEDYSRFLDLQKGVEVAGKWEEQKTFIQHFFNTGFDVVLKINRWYALSAQNFAPDPMTAYLRDTIREKGSELLAAFYAYYFSLTEEIPPFKNEIIHRFQSLDPVWEFDPFPAIDGSSKKAENFLKDQVMAAAGSGQLLFNLAAEIGKVAKEEFQHSLQRNDIPPHIGLMLAFLDLYKSQQEAINTLTGRHLDFYYHTVLRGIKAPALPDQAFVTVQLVNGVDSVTIPKGTQLSAGKDSEGDPIIFTTNTDTVVTGAEIMHYHTLRFPSPEQPSPEDDVYAGTVNDFGKPGNTAWSFFGGDASTRNLSVTTAALGFAFSSSDLFLSQGDRQVAILFTLSPEKGNGMKETDLTRCFELQLTAPGGWYTATLQAVTYKVENTSLSFSFRIAPSGPAIVAYTEKDHGTGFHSSWPVCKINLTKAGRQKYQSLQKLSVRSVAVKANVTGVFDVLVENDLGKLSSALPFIPFADSSTGSSLYMGSREFFVKRLTDIRFSITWDKLPSGFRAYYQTYNDYYNHHASASEVVKVPVFQNQAFKAKLYVLSGEAWVPVTGSNGNPGEYCLFTAETGARSPEAPLVPQGVKVISVNGPFPVNQDLGAYDRLDNTLLEGFFCLTLSAPSQGFGAIDYPTILSEVALENGMTALHNARWFAFDKKKLKPLPYAPYVPHVSGLEAAYSSEQEYPVIASQKNLQWYHIHPFGSTPVSFQSTSLSLLPAYPDQAYAYFGLDRIRPNTELSFYISLTDRVRSVSAVSPASYTFEYCSDHGWEPLTVISDGTSGFQRTGVIRVVIPQDVTSNGTEVPAGWSWLRFGQKISRTIEALFVSTQAVTAVRELTQGGNYTPIGESSITKFITPVPGIKNVLQPVSSFGGLPEQTEAAFRRSVAVRLRHKRRAVSPKDIENILLDQFPQLFKVTAIPARCSTPASAGLVRVIVTPWTSRLADHGYEPQASSELMLEAWSLLQSIGMPSARYEISNPVFSVVLVTCNVVFSEAGKNEELINRLNADICNFLSPWIMDNPLKKDASVMVSSGAVYAFIRSRHYVGSVLDFRCSITGNDQKDLAIVAKDPEVLLVPSPCHAINVVSSAAQQPVDDASPGLRIGKTFYIID
jgi:hypothetical protein